jgi:uncharacterized iron-regulated protein
VLVLLAAGAAATAAGPAIFDSAAGSGIDEPALVTRLAAARYRLLGEVHDNPASHRLRAGLLRDLASRGQRPAVLLEQFDLPHDDALLEAQAAGADADTLARAGKLDRRGWKWPLHEPIIAAALAAHLPVRAANLPGEVLVPLLRDGNEGRVGDEVKETAARAPWSAAQESGLEDEIREAHCGKLPDTLVPRFARAQRLRDAAMARALVRDATAGGAVLIAGNGHVRRDRGVPAYLPAGESLSVGFIELEPGEDAGKVARELRESYDYVWFIPPVQRPDPCAAMKSPPAPR